MKMCVRCIHIYVYVYVFIHVYICVYVHQPLLCTRPPVSNILFVHVHINMLVTRVVCIICRCV